MSKMQNEVLWGDIRGEAAAKSYTVLLLHKARGALWGCG